MSVNVVMPHMGESVVEGTITAWLKQPGEAVQEDEPLVEIETDKINVEVSSPASGTLLKVLAEEGAKVQVDQTIAVIGESGETVEEAPPKKVRPARPPTEAGGRGPEPQVSQPRPSGLRPPAPEPAPVSGPVEVGRFGVYASPAVRRFAREQRVDLGKVKGTGRMGRITREDVEGYLAGAAQEEAAAPAPAEPAEGEAPRPRAQQAGEDEELVPLSPMRKAIAEHMVRSRREAPHVTTVAEVDMSAVAALRDRWKAAYADEGVKLTYMAFILGAVARALKEFPDLNAEWTDKGILVKYRIHLGVAVAVEEGLVVPVIRDADRLSLRDLARAVQTVAEKTRQGKVSPKDLKDGTFTITNPGVFGAVISTPIIHQPQAAILATGRIADVPAVVDGGIAIRKHMFLSLSYDHRIVDGATAVRFLQRVREILEKADFPQEG